MTKPPPGRPLSWHLGLLCAALLVPTFALGGFLVLRIAGAERERHQAAARDAARHLAVTLDRGMTTYQAMLEVLATSDYLKGGNLRAFSARARDVRRPFDARIVLRDAAGRILADTAEAGEGLSPAGAGGAGGQAADTAAQAVASGHSQVSDFLPPGASGQPSGFLVATPVRGRDGTIFATLELVVPAAALGRLFREERTPDGMAAALLDRAGRIGALDRPAPGAPALPPDVLARAEGRETGWIQLSAPDGTELVAAFARSDVAGWTAVVYLPAADFAGPLRRSLLLAACLAALLATLAAALAHGFARRIARPIEALAGAAYMPGRLALGPVTPLREVNALARALAEAEAEARRRAGEREALLGTLDLAQVFVREPAGAITLWTSGMERLLGWRRDEALGRVSHELLDTVLPRPLAEIEAELIRRGEWRGELRQRRADGAVIVVASHWAVRRAADGTPVAVVEACSDITALREAEARLHETQAELFRVARVNSMGAMAAALAHELNQPLAAAANFAEAARLLLGRPAPADGRAAKAQEALAEAAGEVVRAGRILQRLREFVGRGDGEKRPADANALVAGAAMLALAGGTDARIPVRLDLDQAAPPVLADAVQVQQVVVNLVRNAAEAMRASPRRDLLVATRALGSGGVEVSVADTGPGLADEIGARLFEPFVTTKADGMGVGLSISRSIVQAHGGTLEAAPRAGGGTVFRFTLPAMVPAPGEESADAA